MGLFGSSILAGLGWGLGLGGRPGVAGGGRDSWFAGVGKAADLKPRSYSWCRPGSVVEGGESSSGLWKCGKLHGGGAATYDRMVQRREAPRCCECEIRTPVCMSERGFSSSGDALGFPTNSQMMSGTYDCTIGPSPAAVQRSKKPKIRANPDKTPPRRPAVERETLALGGPFKAAIWLCPEESPKAP